MYRLQPHIESHELIFFFRIDKIQYEVVKVDNQVSRDKANTMKTIMHLTNWIKVF